MDRLPRAALLLGLAGLVPAVVAVLVLWLGPADWHFHALDAHASYAALIVSFTGGMWWGIGVFRDRPAAVLLLSVVPSLAAWATLMLLPANAALALFAAMFFMSLGGDRWLASRGLVASWWVDFRTLLSFGMGLLALVANFLAG